MIANPTTLTNLQAEWTGVVKLHERMKLLTVATFAGGAITGPALANVLYNLPMLLAFDVLKNVVQAARDEGTVVWPRDSKLWVGSKTALLWNDWDELMAGVGRRNEIAHDGKLLDSSECLKDIANVREQLVAWAIIDAA